jgi:dolichol-phosphate mannosyltransferase
MPIQRIFAVIPAYKATASILSVLGQIGPEVERIFVVDDKCPQDTGALVERECKDARVKVIRNASNLGVGGAVKVGYAAALQEGAEVIVKLDADGQMDPREVARLAGPILRGEADYSKGNRFFDIEHLGRMPSIRVFGNAILSLFSKLSSGYWDIFDPTNGFTAIHANVAALLPLAKISNRYFFESDMLFRLGTYRAVVVDVPMTAIYGEERSNLKILEIIPEFLAKHTSAFFKRLLYNYVLRGMSAATVELVAGLIAIVFGLSFGLYHWITGFALGLPSSAGTVMLAALPIIVGLQLLLAFLSYDVSSVPRVPIHRNLAIYPKL